MLTLNKLLRCLIVLSFLLVTACELTDGERSVLDDATNAVPSPGQDIEHPPLEIGCFEEKHYQPDAVISKKIDLLFVIDTSGSIVDERARIGEGVEAFIAALPPDVDARVAVNVGHVGANSGKIYRKSETEPLVYDTSVHSLDEIKTSLANRMKTADWEWDSDGGEAGLYSLDQMLDPENVNLAKSQGFFREDAALAVVFVSDENDICARYPEGVTPVYDGDGLEGPAFDAYCANVTPSSVYSKLKLFQQGRPLVVAGILYHELSIFPNEGENEIGYGYLEMIREANGAIVDLSQERYHEGLEQIGSLVTKKLNLVLDYTLQQTNIDKETINVKVDGSEVPYSFSSDSNVLSLTDYAGKENSEVYITYCEPEPVVDLPAAVISAVVVTDITATSATVKWITDIPATSQVEIKHLLSGTIVLSSLDSTEKTEHSVVLTGLQPDTLYSVTAISKANEKETRGEPSVGFRTGRNLN